MDDLGQGIEVVSRDSGPGIPDLKRALEDHYTTYNSMGCGLGVVRRLMDEFDIYSYPPPVSRGFSQRTARPYGTIITTRKWAWEPTAKRPFIYSGYSRPVPGEKANGDAFLVIDERDGLFVAVVDGLGHGPRAEAAGRKTMECIRENQGLEFDHLMLLVHQALRDTRGAALTLVRLRLSERTITHVGVGNVQARIYPFDGSGFIPYPGILGSGMPPRIKINRAAWPKGGVLILFTDGLSGRWDFKINPDLLNLHVTTLSNLLIQEYAQPKDDATVVVVKEVAP